jgi:ribosomal protein L12E/L44/L45/RPP1/RPP2
MKTIAAALLVALSGKPVTEDAIKAVLKSVGAKENQAEIKNVADALKGKKPEDVIAEGMKKLSASAPASHEEHHEEEHKDDKKGGKDKGKDKGGKDKGKEKKEEKKKVEKKEESDDEDIGLGGLF